MPVWPASLPQQQFHGLTVQRQAATVNFEPDAGVPKSRREFAARRRVSTPIALSGTQKQTFESFYVTALQEGALPFDWSDPETDATVEFKFIGDPPQFTLFVGGTTSTRKWLGSLNLMVITPWP